MRWLRLLPIAFAMASSGAVGQERFTLPAPRLKGPLSLEEVLQSRRSVRAFSAAALQRAEVGQLLWAAQGITEPVAGLRTAPSAGALYSLEIYLAVGDVEGLSPGVYHYDPPHHRLERRFTGDPRTSLAAAAYGQFSVDHNAALAIITGIKGRLARKYSQRATRYMTLEAGHAAQNLLLQATALGLGAVSVGAFDDRVVAAALRLPNGEDPLYLIPIGRR